MKSNLTEKIQTALNDGDLPGAVKLAKRGLKKAVSQSDRAELLYLLGNALYQQTRVVEAAENLLEARQIWARLGIEPNRSAFAGSMAAAALSDCGEIAESVRVIEEVGEELNDSMSLNEILIHERHHAIVMSRAGDLALSEEGFRGIISILKEIPDTTELELCEAEGDLVQLLFSQGRIHEANVLILKILKMAPRDAPGLYGWYQCAAMCAGQIGDTDTAIKLYRKALDAWKKHTGRTDGAEAHRILCGIALMLMRQEKVDEALVILRKFRTAREGEALFYRLAYAEALAMKGNYRKAIDELQKMRPLIVARVPVGHAGPQEIDLRIATYAYESEDWNLAQEAGDRFMALAVNPGFKYHTYYEGGVSLQTLVLLKKALEGRDDSYYQTAMEIVRRELIPAEYIPRLHTGFFIRVSGADHITVFFSGLFCLFAEYWLVTKTKPILSLLEFFTARRLSSDASRNLLLFENRSGRFEGRPTLMRAANALLRLSTFVQSERSGGGAVVDGAAVGDAEPVTMNEIRRMETELASAIQELRSADPELAGLYFPEFINDQALKDALSSGECVLYCVDSGDEAFGVFVEHGSPVHIYTLLPDDDAEAAFFDESEAIDDPDSESESLGIADDLTRFAMANQPQLAALRARKIHERLLKPIEDKIKGKRLRIVPQGHFYSLPYALLQNSDGVFLDDISLWSVIPSLSDLVRSRDAEYPAIEKRKQFLGVGGIQTFVDGDPSLEDLKEWRLSEIPLTESEIQSTASFFDTAEILTGTAATVEAVLEKDWSKYEYILFSCHNIGRRLCLAFDPSKPGQRFLTEEDIMVRGAYGTTVILAACGTVRGTYDGPEILSVARAFLAAGARAVIATAFAVEDRHAFPFVTELCRAFAAGDGDQSPAEVASNTRRLLRKRGLPPAAWGSWTVIDRG